MMQTSTPTLLLTLTLLAGCGGGGGESPAPISNAPDTSDSPPPTTLNDGETFNPGGSLIGGNIFSCAAPYYRELEGLYDGQITYLGRTTDDSDPAAASCTFEVELAVTTRYPAAIPNGPLCELRGEFASSQLGSATNSPECAGTGPVRGDLFAPYFGDLDLIADPVYPVDASMSLPAQLPEGEIHGIGEFTSFSGARSIRFRFDGLGNVDLGESTSPDSPYDGRLIKR